MRWSVSFWPLAALGIEKDSVSLSGCHAVLPEPESSHRWCIWKYRHFDNIAFTIRFLFFPLNYPLSSSISLAFYDGSYKLNHNRCVKSDIVTYLDKDVLNGFIVKRVSKNEHSLLAFASSKFSTTFVFRLNGFLCCRISCYKLLVIFSKPRNYAVNK